MLASQLGQDDKFGLPKEHRTFFNKLDAWRNYLLHSDEKSRESLRRALEGQGHTDQVSEINLLDSAYAVSTMDKTEAACRWAEALTGIPASFLLGAWVATDEG
ncbi:hypothetical protein [Streptomyces sp. DT203]|uniref:hypothetical protein n=1 Tax=Streptomyces sp. DT203 TaxID=3393424 RepID=UPI003CEF5931